jgi:RNA recognition motif-containing protein
MNIYIANIPFRANEDELRELFEGYGSVASVKIILDKETQRSRGFGFVEMDDDGEAQAAIEGVNGTDFQGKVLVVNEARPREPRSDFKPRSGGFGGGRQGGGGGGGGYQQRSGGSSREGGWKSKDRY